MLVLEVEFVHFYFSFTVHVSSLQ